METMTTEKAKTYVKEWINNFSNRQWRDLSLFNYFMWDDSNELQIEIKEGMEITLQLKLKNIIICQYPINDLQSTCAFLSHITEGIPLDFNMNKLKKE